MQHLGVVVSGTVLRGCRTSPFNIGLSDLKYKVTRDEGSATIICEIGEEPGKMEVDRTMANAEEDVAAWILQAMCYNPVSCPFRALYC